MKELLSPELEQAFLRNQLSWWKNRAIHETCMSVLCKVNGGVWVTPNRQMWDMTEKELERMCEDELLKSYEESKKKQ